MKRISLILPFFLFFGCNSTQNLGFSTKQSSISSQKRDAQNAWDELDGKVVKNSQIQTQNNSLNNNSTNIKSMLEISNSIPNWFYSPPKSDKYFYGAGDGTNVQQSKISALNFIAGEIQTEVSSEFNSNSGYSNYNGNKEFYKNVRNKVNAEVHKIDFTNIEIMKTVKVNNNIYLLLRINKQQLFNSLKTKFDILNSQIKNEVKIATKYSLLDQLITYNKITPKITSALGQLNILNTLNPTFNIQSYVNIYNNYISKKSEILHKITFSVTPNDAFGQKFIEVLNNQNYKISSNSDIKIRLQEQIRKSNPMGMSVIKATINIKLISKGKILKSNSIEVKGISNNYQQALTEATQNFTQKLQEIGINKLLGFE